MSNYIHDELKDRFLTFSNHKRELDILDLQYVSE